MPDGFFSHKKKIFVFGMRVRSFFMSQGSLPDTRCLLLLCKVPSQCGWTRGDVTNHARTARLLKSDFKGSKEKMFYFQERM